MLDRSSHLIQDRFKVSQCGVSRPQDESILFRQKEPKPCLPVRGGPSEPAQKQVFRPEWRVGQIDALCFDKLVGILHQLHSHNFRFQIIGPATA